ncbi:hypothetical protein LJC34_07065 [Oscillospiraceae bacterium OttesenSCG-928-G22]|nr:hypothetical protein [Oscillospiraceae bacterium OttesenSCG-928-G22]
MEMRISSVNNSDGAYKIYFEGVGHWDDFDLILRLLQQEENCIVGERRDIVYAREAELQNNDNAFQLRHDDALGTFLYTTDENLVELLERLANNVINSIKEKLERLQEEE